MNTYDQTIEKCPLRIRWFNGDGSVSEKVGFDRGQVGEKFRFVTEESQMYVIDVPVIISIDQLGWIRIHQTNTGSL